MSRFGRIRRRPDHWASAHERARARAAERVDGPLGLSEATWLDAHLAECAECAAIAASYETDRQALRAMRGAMPEPPRDLWARTAAAIEQESVARGRTPRRTPSRDRRVPLGALSGLAVIAVVVGVSTMSSGFGLFGSGGSASTAAADAARQYAASAAPELSTDATTGGGVAAQVEPTPIAVAAGRVRWVDLDRQSGSLAFNAADIEEVCPADAEAGCATLADDSAKRVSLASSPETIIAAPDDEQAIVVSRDASGAQQLTVVDLPPVDAVTVTASEPPAGETPVASPPPGETASAAPTADAQGSAAPSPSTAPTEPTASVEPSPSPEVQPSGTPEASQAAELAIASDIEIIGESAAFSADGAWFAFTARAVGDASGSNVYVWKVGDPTALPITSDGQSAFASWDGDQVVISRVPPMGNTSAEPLPDPIGESVTIDPTTGAEARSATTWRPAIDPTGTRAVTWVGSLKAGDDGTFHPDEGSLELVSWPDGARDATSESVVDGAIGDFDVRWDETGEWFAVWTADPADPTIGRLSLFNVTDDGTLSRPDGAPAEVPALPGFSIGDGRLAWATPPGQGGEGSRVRIVAWKGDGVGRVETAPGEVLVVIR